MSSLAASASADLADALRPDLSAGERAKVGAQLGTAMLAAGLLAAAWAYQLVAGPEQRPVADLLKAAAALIVAVPLFVTAARGLVTGDPDTIVEQLVALAVLAAMASGEFGTAVLVPLLVGLGHFLERRSALGAQAAIDGLKQLHARRAVRLTGTGEEDVTPADLHPGDLVRVYPGEVVPADGTVRTGASAVDQSSVTGESVPEEVGPGTRVFAGAVNLSGPLDVAVTGVGGQTALGQVLGLLREAERSKTPTLKLLERYAGYYVPIVLLIAGVVLFASRDLSRAVAVLVVACPGAFVLAGPTAMIAALGAASRLGVLVKNAKFLEALADADTLVLDKTGTVTLGRLAVVDVVPTAGHDRAAVLAAAAVCARGSRHPASRAVAEAAGPVADSEPAAVEEVAGNGVVAVRGGERLLLGRREWLQGLGLAVPDAPDHAGPLAWVARGDVVLGAVLLADLPRPEAAAAVHDLRGLGLGRVVLLTGDRRAVAEQVAGTLGIEVVIAEVLPAQKLLAVRAEVAAGRRVMVVGDGVNDALALASGDVGVAMGAMGSEIALRSADVALMTNDLGRLPLAVRLARATRAVINQNLLVGAGFSALMLALAAAGVVSPLAGAVLHNLGEVYVVFNSARLLRFGTDH